MLSTQDRKAFIDSAMETHKNEVNSVADYLRSRNIFRILHFTHFSNLDSIFSIGLQTKAFLSSKGHDFVDTDKQRFDGFLESISFSIHIPNTFLLTLKNTEFKNELVVLEFAANNLLVKPFAAFPSNAAGGAFSDAVLKDPLRFVGKRGLEGLYLNKSLRSEASLELAEPTDQQSEILFFDSINSDHIIAIHVSSNFPEEKILSLKTIVSEKLHIRLHENCNCGFFTRWSGKYRKYEQEWEVDGQ